jgi:hypothetical protein
MTDFILILILAYSQPTMTATPGYVSRELCDKAGKEWLEHVKPIAREAHAFCITGPNS